MTHDVSKISADSLFWVKHYLIEVHSVCIYLLNLIPNDLLICLHSLKSALIFENYSFDKSNKQNSNIKPVSPQFIIYCMVTQCQNIYLQVAISHLVTMGSIFCKQVPLYIEQVLTWK